MDDDSQSAGRLLSQEVPDRKAVILDAARTMFAERGLKQTTVRQISAQAGVLPGSLHYFFPTKLDLVDAILSQFCAEVLAGYARIATTEAGAVQRLEAMARYAFSLLPGHAAAMVVILNESDDLVSDQRFAYLVEFNSAVEKHWTTTLRGGVKDGKIRADLDVVLFYRFARDAILGATTWYHPGSGATIAAVADEFIATMILGLAVH